MEPETSTALESLFKSIQTFGSITASEECRNKLYRYNDALMQSLHSILEEDDYSPEEKMKVFDTTMAEYTAAMKELFPKLANQNVDKPAETKAAVGKSDEGRFIQIVELEKFNPYHGKDGRFATSTGYASFTIRTRDPGKQHLADNAIAREKERDAAARAAAAPKFTPAKTKKEAVAYAQQELGFSKVSYGTKLNIDTINHVNEQITNIQHKYPEAKGAVQELKTTSAGCYARICTSSDGTMSFDIGTKMYGQGMDYIKKSYDRDVESGFHPTGTGHESIIWHEFGHVLANVSTKSQFGISSTGKVANDMSTKVAFIQNRRGNKTEKDWLYAAAKNTGMKPSQMMSGISRYAQKNPAETFAEAFAEANCSKAPRKEASAIVEASGWKR